MRTAEKPQKGVRSTPCGQLISCLSVCASGRPSVRIAEGGNRRPKAVAVSPKAEFARIRIRIRIRIRKGLGFQTNHFISFEFNVL